MQSFPVFSSVGPVEMTTPSNVTLTNSVNPGEVWMFKGEEYIYVYNAGNSQAIPGNCMTLSFNSGYSLTITTVTQYDFPLGVVKHATLATGAYGWLLTRGFTPIALAASNSAAVGDLLFPAANGLFGTVSNSTSFTTGTAIQPIGYVVQAGASGLSGGTCVGYVRCYGT